MKEKVTNKKKEQSTKREEAIPTVKAPEYLLEENDWFRNTLLENETDRYIKMEREIEFNKHALEVDKFEFYKKEKTVTIVGGFLLLILAYMFIFRKNK